AGSTEQERTAAWAVVVVISENGGRLKTRLVGRAPSSARLRPPEISHKTACPCYEVDGLWV
ncbi:unnamed protein product, partial [Ectocarpus sp. 12 AP-2014]